MKNLLYVVVNVKDEQIITVTDDIEHAYRAAKHAHDCGIRKKDVSITPMKLNVQYGSGTEMCYDDEDIQDVLEQMESWEEDLEDEDEDEDEDEELPSDEEVLNLIRRVLYGQ